MIVFLLMDILNSLVSGGNYSHYVSFHLFNRTLVILVLEAFLLDFSLKFVGHIVHYLFESSFEVCHPLKSFKATLKLLSVFLNSLVIFVSAVDLETIQFLNSAVNSFGEITDWHLHDWILERRLLERFENLRDRFKQLSFDLIYVDVTLNEGCCDLLVEDLDRLV